MSQVRRNRIHWLFRRVILGPFVYLITRPRVIGRAHLPKSGGFIVAVNHQSKVDPIVIGVVLGRYELHFLAKKELWDDPRGRLRFLGVLKRWFMHHSGSIKTRGGDTINKASLESGAREVLEGEVVAIFPEGTCALDGKTHRGYDGVARMAYDTGAPVLVVAVRYPEKWWRRTTVRIHPLFMMPILLDRTPQQERELTLRIMTELSQSSDRPYEDTFVKRKRKR